MFVEGGPTEAGFLLFLRQIVGVPIAALPDNAPVIPLVYAVSVSTVYEALAGVAPDLYELAVYNLATSRLIYYAPDQPGETYFTDLRALYKVNSFIAGVISSSGDNGTNQSIDVTNSLKNLTIGDLMNMKDPYGLAYLAIVQDMGSIWGLT